MLLHSLAQIIRYANVQRAVTSARKHVDVIHLMSSPRRRGPITTTADDRRSGNFFRIKRQHSVQVPAGARHRAALRADPLAGTTEITPPPCASFPIRATPWRHAALRPDTPDR